MRSTYVLFILFFSCFFACTSSNSDTSAAEPGNTPPVQSSLSAQTSDRGETAAVIGGVEISIAYGRPAMGVQDRTAGLEPGFVWRLGKNEATTLTTSGELQFGEVTVPAGSYSLFAEKGAEEGAWTLLINSETGLWGSFEHDPEKDIGRVPLEKGTAEGATDLLLIQLEKLEEQRGALVIKWGDQQLRTEFRVG